MKKNILENLNPRQREAVELTAGPVLILAGPGSGKTRVLTHKIAYLISKGVKPENILAVTFTNKAADEMRERVAKLLTVDKRRSESPSANTQKYKYADNFSVHQRMRAERAPNLRGSAALPFIGTFHAFCLRVLRKEIKRLGYKSNFVIYDDGDKLSLLKKKIAELNIDKEQFNPNVVSSKISSLKSELIDWQKFSEAASNFFEEKIAEIYSAYQKELKRLNAVDFDDLIMLTVEIFSRYPAVLKKYQDKLKYILVDEYQDTNTAQYVLINLLAQKHRNICVVGDDAQSIYRFRNADFRNILNFERDYPDAKVVILDQNYRSTQVIIKAAQEIISKNVYQKEKKLWTENPVGEPITIAMTEDEVKEAEFVIGQIKELQKKKKFNLSDFVILYRVNAQSRSLEEVLIREGIPYKIVGAVKFYQRKEIKDVLAYLKFIAFPNDVVSLERIINLPPRGIGEITKNLAVPYILGRDEDKKDIKARELQVINNFKNIIERARKIIQKGSLCELTEFLLKEIDYKAYLEKNYKNKSYIEGVYEYEIRWQNVQELFSVLKKYDEEFLFEKAKNKPMEALKKFLEDIALLSENDEMETNKDVLNLMTIHAAKGLEFPVVFIMGCEEGVFPHGKSLINQEEMEEERRLCYVGITRAKELLYLTFTKRRTLYGITQANPPSRFLGDIPGELVEYKIIEEGDENFMEI